MKCQQPHLAGDPRYAETWMLLEGCDREASRIVAVTALEARGGPYQSRPPREPVEIAIGACGACAAAVAVQGVTVWTMGVGR